jgi:integrase
MKAARVLKFHQEGSIQKWQVIIPAEHNEGKRWFRRFQTKKEAEAFADKFSRDPFGTVAELRGLKTAARPAFLARNDRENAEILFRHMIAKLGDSVAEGIKAIDYYFNTHHAVKRITLADAVREYHAHRTQLALKPRVLSDDESRLGKLVTLFGASELASITTPELRRFFVGIPLSEDGKASNRITYRMKIGAFFTWAHEEAKYLRENPIAPISKDSLGEMGVNDEYYEVDQFLRMLRIAQGVEPVAEGGVTTTEFRDTLFPWFIISGFSGLRSGEAFRQKHASDALRWSDIHFGAETPHINVRGEIAKGGKKKNERPIDEGFVVAALQAWLSLVERQSEFVCATAPQIYAAKERFTELTGIEFNENGLRNSFATYARAYCGSGARVSELMGNSLSVARKHYITALPAGRGQAYFGLRPLAVVEQAA